MGGELDTAWIEQSVGPGHVYFALAAFLVFRIIIAALQNRAELEAWFRLRRAGWARRLRQAGL
ncbi:MAG TPA: hypothetical protein VMU85_11235 [Stellaceae bacterium]|nr:hypothetical protein [Stellaceae bacterium]